MMINHNLHGHDGNIDLDAGGDDDDDDDEYILNIMSRPSSDEPHRPGRTRSTNASPTNSE